MATNVCVDCGKKWYLRIRQYAATENVIDGFTLSARTSRMKDTNVWLQISGQNGQVIETTVYSRLTLKNGGLCLRTCN